MEIPDSSLPERETPLNGGNTSVVVRLGASVRRTAGPWTPAVHRLLRHLEEVGFAGAPQVLGVDGRGREMVRFVAGEVGTLSSEAPLAPWFRTPDACRAVGRWIRRFQEAQAGFRPESGEPWRRAPGGALGPGQVVAHHDVSPYNTVHRDDGTIVVLDWDFARPGDRLDDLAWAAWRWAPLMTGTWWHAEFAVAPDEDVPARQRANLAALVEGYGPSASQLAALPDAIGVQMSSHADDLEEPARTDPVFAALIERGYARAARDDAAWWSDEEIRHAMLPAAYTREDV